MIMRFGSSNYQSLTEYLNMYEYNSSIRLKILCCVMIITIISVLTCVECTATETISDNNHGLSSDPYGYKSDDQTKENNPTIEGFIILTDNQKKQPSADSTMKKQSSISRTWSNTTAKAKSKTKHTTPSKSTTTIKPKSLQKISNHMVISPIRHGRRLLNDFSYDTDLSATNTSSDFASDVDSFLAVNDEELSKQLVNMALSVDGSGTTIEETSEPTSIATSESSTSTVFVSIATITPAGTETFSSTEVTFTQLSTGSELSTTATNQVTMGTETQASVTYTAATESSSTLGQLTTSESSIIGNTEQSSSATTYTQITSEQTAETNPTIQSSTTTPTSITTATEFVSIETVQTILLSTTTIPTISISTETSTSGTTNTVSATTITATTNTGSSSTASELTTTIATETGITGSSATISTSTISSTGTVVSEATSETVSTIAPTISIVTASSTAITVTETGATISEVETTQTTTTSFTSVVTATSIAESSSTTPLIGTEGPTSSFTGIELSTQTTAAPETETTPLIVSSITPVTGTEGSTSTTATSFTGTGTFIASSTTPVTGTETFTTTTATQVTGTEIIVSSSTTLVTGTEIFTTTTATQVTGTGSIVSSSTTPVTGTEIFTTATGTQVTGTATIVSSSTTPVTGTEVFTTATTTQVTGTGTFIASSTTPVTGTEVFTTATGTQVTGTATLIASSTTPVTGTQGSTSTTATGITEIEVSIGTTPAPVTGTETVISSSTTAITGTEIFITTTGTQVTGTATIVSSSTTPVTGTQGSTSTTVTGITGIEISTETTALPTTGTQGSTSTTVTGITGIEISTETTAVPTTGTQGSTSTTVTGITGIEISTPTTATQVTGTEIIVSSSTTQVTGTEVFTTTTVTQVTGTGTVISSSTTPLTGTEVFTTTTATQVTGTGTFIASSTTPVTGTEIFTTTTATQVTGTGTVIASSTAPVTGTQGSTSTTITGITGIEISTPTTATQVTGTGSIVSSSTTPVTGTEVFTTTTVTQVTGSGTVISSSTTPVTGTQGSTSTTVTGITGIEVSTQTTATTVTGTGTSISSSTTPVAGSESSTLTSSAQVTSNEATILTSTTAVTGTGTSTTATGITGTETFISSSTTPVTGTQTITSTTATPATGTGTFISSSTTPMTGTEGSTSTTATPITGTGTFISSSTTPITGTQTATSVTGTGTGISSSTTPIAGTEGSISTTSSPITGTGTFISSTTTPVTGTQTVTSVTATSATGTGTFISSSTTPVTGTLGSTSTTATPITGTGTFISSSTTPITGTQTATSETATSVTGTGTGISSSTTPIAGTEGSTSTASSPITGTGTFISSTTTPITGTQTATSISATAATGTFISSSTTPVTGSEASTSTTATSVTGTGTFISSTTTPITGTQTATSVTGTGTGISSSTTPIAGTEGSTSTASSPITGTGTLISSTTTPITGTQTATSISATGATGTFISSSTTPVTGTEASTSATATSVTGTGTVIPSSTTPVTGTQGSTSSTATGITGIEVSTATTGAPVTGIETVIPSSTTPVTGTQGSTSTTATGITGIEVSTATTAAPVTGTATVISSSTTPVTETQGSTSTTSSSITGTETFISSSTTPVTGSQTTTSTIVTSATGTGTFIPSSTTPVTATQSSTSTTLVTGTETFISSSTTPVTATQSSTSTTITLETGTGTFVSSSTTVVTGTEESTSGTGTATSSATTLTTATEGFTSASVALTGTSVTLSSSTPIGGTESTISTPAATTTITAGSTSQGPSTQPSITTSITQTTVTTMSTTTTVSGTTMTSTLATVCTSIEQSVTECIVNITGVCNSDTIGYQTIETTYTCSNSSLAIITVSQKNCTPSCPVTEVLFSSTPSSVNLNMRITPVPLPFPYQYTNESTSYNTLWVTDKGYIALDKPFYAIEPSVNELPDAPYIAPLWTNLVYVSSTQIKPVIYNGLSAGSDVLEKVQETVVRQNQTPITDEGIAYRVVKIQWINLITSIDNMTNANASDSSSAVLFDAYLINGPGNNYTIWNSYLRFDYNISPNFVSADYQPVVIGYHTTGDTSHKSSVSFTNKISDFITGTNVSHTYLLSSRLLSSCEQWYWITYTDILYRRTANLTTVKRNPCPCSYAQASSDFRFYRMNSENRLEKSSNVSCFVPLSAFAQRTSDAQIYQQTCCYNTYDGSLITSDEFAGSVLDDETFVSLRYVSDRPQRNQQRDACCIATDGAIDWNSYCNLYYQLRPPSTCIGYVPPSQAWFGGDPHVQTLSNTDYTCNVYGSFVYAETTTQAKTIAKEVTTTSSVYLKSLVTNELFSIIARTSKTPALLQVNSLYNQDMTYFSSFTMYLGLENNVIIDVSINPTNTYQFQVTYNITSAGISGTPFNLTNDYVEYFYYPSTSTNDSSKLPFSIIKENQTISAVPWSAYSSSQSNNSLQIEVPKLTISTWSGLAMQCYLVTNNMACTLLLPDKYAGLVDGLAFGTTTGDANQYCISQSSTGNATGLPTISQSIVMAWFNTSASPTYRNYINQIACPMDQSLPTYKFCLQDTLLSQSALLGQLTVKSSSDYQSADRSLNENPPQVSLVSPTSINSPYTYLLTIPYTATFQNATYQYINVTIDRTSSIVVQIRDGNTSIPRNCINYNTYYACPFLYTNESRSRIQLTVIASDTQSNLMTSQKIQLIVNECVDGTANWNNPTVLSSAVSVLFCTCNDLAAGTYCERPVGCTDMTACQINFISNITCNTNVTSISINNTRVPYYCVNQLTNQICTNNSECCKSGYEFYDDVQQCLWRPVCDQFLCGTNGTCVDSELKPHGYICMCNNATSVFNGTTCVQRNICDDPSFHSGALPCTGSFQIGVDSGSQCICECQPGFTNTSTGCNAPTVVCDETTDVCNDTSAPSTPFCRYRTQTYNAVTGQCQTTFCNDYCQNGTCMANKTGYSCICPPGTSLDNDLNCAACANGLAGPNCGLICNCEFGLCNTNATSDSNKCTCAPGYTGIQCNQNINYCDRTADVCQTSVSHKVCTLVPTNRDTYVNSTGYACTCSSGYTNNSAAVCQDVDECIVASNQENVCPDATTYCVNYPGTYSCDCKSGYMKDNTSATGACVDIDECVTNATACSAYSNAYCVNLSPSFQCRCNYGYSPGGDYNQIYVALTGNQTCQIYDQCAASGISCGAGHCLNNTSPTGPSPSCYCDIPLTLVQLSSSKYDCVCQSANYFYTNGQCVERPDEGGLDGLSTFHVTIDCTNATGTVNEILQKLNATFKRPYTISVSYDPLGCDQSGNINVKLNISTDSNITAQTDLFESLNNVTNSLGIDLYIDGKCFNKSELVTNVTSCYLFNLCNLCGINPRRGACFPENHLSQCTCLSTTNDSSITYTGEFCLPTSIEPPLSTSASSNWTPIIVGVLAGLAGLLCAVTCCLLAVVAYRRRKQLPEEDVRIRRIWHLPRAQVPTTVTAENVQTYINSTSSITNSIEAEDSTLSSDRSTYRTTYDHDPSGTANSTFFKQLDQAMGPKLRATITRPDISGILSSLPTVTETSSSLTTTTSNSDDPIDELDAIIDDEDINMTFHDPLDDLFDDDQMLEVINPNLKIPRAKIDSEPTGFFSFFNRH